MNSDIWMSLAYFALGAYFFWEWIGDYKKNKNGEELKNPFPGIGQSSRLPVLFGIIGALLLVGLETGGEYALGIAAEQKTIAAHFFLAMTAAAFVEELIFRGYLADFLTNKVHNSFLVVVGIILFSLIFALAHNHLWTWGDEGLTFHFTIKAWFSTSILFLNSLLFYALRFLFFNKEKSLIPCMVAHLVSNWAVFGIKWAQGFVEL